MTEDERQALKALFVANAQYFDQLIPDDVLPMYVEDLADLPFGRVANAMRDLRRDPSVKRCPLPAQIRAKLTPESNPDGEAVLVVGRITEAMARLGPYRIKEAKEFVGPIGWEVCTLDGGWEHVCTLESDALYAHKAQWRNLAKTLIERGFKPADRWIEIESKAATPGMASIHDVLKRIPIKEEV